MNEEEKKQLEKDKAQAWLHGQRLAKLHFNKEAFEANRKLALAEAEAKKMGELTEATERTVKEAGKIEKSQVRRMKDESKRIKRAS